MSDITTLRAEIRKLALHLQESAHRHGEVDAYCFWSPQMYRDACVQSNAALTALLNRIDAALSGACGSDSAPDEPRAALRLTDESQGVAEPVAWMDPQSRAAAQEPKP